MQDHPGQESLMEPEADSHMRSVTSNKVLNFTPCNFRVFYVHIPAFLENWFYVFST